MVINLEALFAPNPERKEERIHPDASAGANALAAYFDAAGYGHADTVLQLVPYGAGFAWLKPSVVYGGDHQDEGGDDRRYTITYEGQRALRMAELFGTEEFAG